MQNGIRKPLEIYDIGSHGIPLPGPDFWANAQGMGDTSVIDAKTSALTAGPELIDLYRRALREPGFEMTMTIRPGRREPVRFIPGHIWGQHWAEYLRSQSDRKSRPRPVDGPHPADVMVIAKNPGSDETMELRNLVGPSGAVLVEHIDKARIPNATNWYVTNLVKFQPPDGIRNLSKSWIKDCLPLLHMELRIVRPKFILCVGADASTALLGKGYGVGSMDGRVVEYHYTYEEDGKIVSRTALVMTVIHPAEVARANDKSRILERGMSRFGMLLQGNRFDQEESDIDHRIISTLEQAEEWCREVDRDFKGLPLNQRLVAWDAEWHGKRPVHYDDAFLMCVQASWAPKKAVVFLLRRKGRTGKGRCVFFDRNKKPAIKPLMALLQRFCEDKIAVGHFFTSDLAWLRAEGFDPTRDHEIPLDPEDGVAPWELLRQGRGYLDTAIMTHAIEETAALGLESLAARYTSAPRYDLPLEEWKKKYCATNGLTTKTMEGYGDCPDRILLPVPGNKLPYATYDADVTRRIAVALLPLLDRDYEGNNCWEPFWEGMLTQPVISEMQSHGMLLDGKRVDKATKTFFQARNRLHARIKEWANWPEFNYASLPETRELLFGEAFNGSPDKKTGQVRRLRPPDAITLGLTPLVNTDKPPKRWEDLVEKGKEKGATAGTSKMVLSILAFDNPEHKDKILDIRNLRFVDQVTKTFLRPPMANERGTWIINDDGLYEYETGLAGMVDPDGRLRTNLSPTTETGRWRSWGPNLQNISKQRDADYELILGKENYKHKIRSIFTASPGYSLLEFDYTGAELYVAAVLAGDATMIEHCSRGMLREDDPNYYDIHSNVAVLAFRLSCAPTKKGLKNADKGHLRVLAKNVIFGMMYGRGARAIAMQARETGADVSVDDAQVIIDTVFELYPGLRALFDEAADRCSTASRVIRHPYGRYRRFPPANDDSQAGENERQAQNFPIQGCVASMVDRGLARLHREIGRLDLREDVRFLLQIHDAGMLEARHHLVPFLKEELIPWAMQDCVPLYRTNLAGEMLSDTPYRIGLDIVVMHHWGEGYSAAECRKVGLPVEYATAV